MADRIALLLHMHQPDYRDPGSGVPRMPWVRLHASRGYLDVATAILETGARPTVNVVPSLLLQLEACAQGRHDRWLELSRKPAEELDEGERAFLRTRFVHGNPRLRRGSPRYEELQARIAELSTPGELRDLQVWSNLAWMGFTARREPLVRRLLAQDRDFSPADLEALLAFQCGLPARVLELWSRLPSLSCSPLCHPILPLLVDFRHARRCLRQLPEDLGPAGDFRWPQDALRQLVEGRAVCERILGRRPAGLWPSEGSVSPEVLELAARAGFSWVASDEEVLHRSLRDRESAPREGSAGIAGPWVRRGDEAGPRLLFRDHALSDRVGFLYQDWDGRAAAADLLAGARERWGPGPGAVPVILDGENPWEAYPDAGEAFLYSLFRSGRVASLDELAQAPAIGCVQRLHTGSWIDADFRIWAGDPEDRHAWGLLAKARQAWEEAGRPEAAWPHLANAESSDWTWWFGPEHHSEVAELFDALFRAHLAAAWTAMGRRVPEELALPIQQSLAEGQRLRPARAGRPPITGRPAPAEWAGAAIIPAPRQGSMARGRSWLHGGLVLVDEETLSLSLGVPAGSAPLWLLVEGQAPRALQASQPPDLLVLRGRGLVQAQLRRPPGPLRLAFASGDGLRHPAEGWFQVEAETLASDPLAAESQASAAVASGSVPPSDRSTA